MTLSTLFRPGDVLLDVAGADREAVLSALASAVATRSGGRLAEAAVLERLRDRERERSTGVGEGVAIPHAKAAEIDSMLAVGARSAQPIEWDAPDRVPCRLFFCLIAPASQPAAHLKALASIVKAVHASASRDALLRAATPEAFLAALQA